MCQRKSFYIFVSLFSFFYFSAGLVFAGTANLSWNANTEPDLAGYKVYYGTSARTATCPPGGYPNVINVGLTATPNAPSQAVPNLADGQTYYFSITAYDASNNESCFSGEVSKIIPISQSSTTDIMAPSTPTNLIANVFSSSQINLSWSSSTDNVGVAGYKIFRNDIQVGTSTGPLYSDIGLTANISYTYTVSSYDAAGNISAQSSPASLSIQLITPKFQIGDRVQVTANKLNVRLVPAGKSIGFHKKGDQGIVIQGPIVAKGYTWWNINYDSGVDGWSAENWLSKIIVAQLDLGTLSQQVSSLRQIVANKMYHSYSSNDKENLLSQLASIGAVLESIRRELEGIH